MKIISIIIGIVSVIFFGCCIAYTAAMRPMDFNNIMSIIIILIGLIAVIKLVVEALMGNK